MTQSRPYSKDELLLSLSALETSGLAFWRELPPETFLKSVDGKWSAADTVRHLGKSTAPVVKALRMPRLVLRTMFGAATAPSIRFEELRARYDSALANGGTAGSFAPSPLEPGDDNAALRDSSVSRLAGCVQSLASALGAWRDQDLDRYRLPHPLLGKLTVREMVMFTLYHHEHHADVMARRLGRDV